MARRRRNRDKSFLEDLLGAPWQLSVVIGVVAFVVLKWIVPAGGAGNQILKPLLLVLSGLAPLVALFFFLLAVIVYLRSAKQTPATQPLAKMGSNRGFNSPRAITQGISANLPDQQEPVVASAIDRLWDETAQEPAGEEKPQEWSIELIQNMEWKRFEDVCQRFYSSKGIRSETTALGPDGGIDIRLYQDESGKATSIVQCKAWGDKIVGVKPVRELLGVMTHEKIGKAFFMTSGRYSDDAKAVAQSNRITLIDGQMLLMMINRLPEPERQELLAFATEGDYKTPTCPSCGIKMKAVAGTAGRADFWGCFNYPRCRQKLGMRRGHFAAN